MTTPRSDALLRHIRKLAALTPSGSDSDGELLRRFAGRREEDAFAALVRRHGPMVLCVCRRVLGNPHDAEDAFQAAFLTLARKASSLRRQDSVAGWVYRVAYRLALRARARIGRRREADRAIFQDRPRESSGADPLGEVTGRELSRVLDEELNRLPEKWRAPLVLCYLEGATRDEAALQLGWPLGTFKHRLEKARAVLRGRLTRRGLALSTVLPGALLTGRATSAALPTPLLDLAVRAGLTGGSSGAAGAVFAGQALRSLLSSRLRVAALLLTLAAFGAGAALLACRPPADTPPPPPADGRAEPRPQQAPPQAAPPVKPNKGEELEVSGSVLDPAGKPIAGAEVAVVMVGMYEPGADGKPTDLNRRREAKADGDGRFRMRVARPAGVRNPSVWALAAAPGFGFGWSDAPGDAPPTNLVIRLHAERTLRGRVLDVEGQPVAGARVRVYRADATGTRPYVNPAPNEVPWPKPVTTGADGRFTFRGIGRDVAITLDVTHERFTPEMLDIEAGDKAGRGEVSVVLTAARTLSGRVVAADTGKPVPGVRLTLQGYAKDSSWASGGVIARTDDEGRFSVRPYRGEVYATFVYPPNGRPYLGVSRRVEWPKSVVKHDVTFELPRGVVVGGTVVDEDKGKPIAGAVVGYRGADGNPKLKFGSSGTRTGPDGTFQLTVIPGAGYLLVQGPTPDYVRRELYSPTGYGGLAEEAKGARVSPAGFARVDLKADAKADDVKIKLRRGVTVEGKLVGPDGKPVLRAKMLSSLNVHGRSHQIAVADPADEVGDGSFRLRGCDPEKTYTVLFLDPEKELGAAVEISPKKAAGGPVTVKLAKCGSATGRLIGRDGTPLKDYPQPSQYLSLEVIVTPGTPRNFTTEKAGAFADTMTLSILDRAHYEGRHSDGEGRITLPALIPGATYRITGGYDPKEGFRFKDFKVEAGKRLDLGDLKLDW